MTGVQTCALPISLHAVDWYPTLLGLAGAELRQPLPLDGRDAWAAITKGAPSPHEEILINAVPRSGAIRAGDWKLVINGGVGANDLDEATGGAGKVARKKSAKAAPAADAVELFNLAADLGEKTDLAAREPARVDRLRAELHAWQREVGAKFPIPNPTYDSAKPSGRRADRKQ